MEKPTKEDLGEKGRTYRVKIDPPEGPKRLVPRWPVGPSLPEPQRVAADHELAPAGAPSAA